MFRYACELFYSYFSITISYRLWYIRDKYFRLWYIRDKEGSRNSLSNGPTPVEVGYMNVIPKCLDSSEKYPIFENLPETYAAVNDYLSESPLEGRSSLIILS